MTADPTDDTSHGGYLYTCPKCAAVVEAERFSDAHVFCPACGAGPFVTEHDCFYDPDEGDEFCTDTLGPAP